MAAGHPLTDEDRCLARHHRRVDRRARGRRRARRGHLLGVKKIYRDKLRRQGVVSVYMQGTFDEVMERFPTAKATS